MVKTNRIAPVFVVALAFALAAPPAGAVAKEIIQLQRDVALLIEQVRELNRLMNERLAVMTHLVEKNTDTTNRLQSQIEQIQRAVQQSVQTALVPLGTAVASQTAKIEAIPPQIQSLHDSLEELKTRQTRLADQMTAMKQLFETIPAAPAAPAAPAPPPPAQTLYDNALRDLQSGKNDLAMSGFSDYLKYYPDGDLAGNAQYHLGDIYYRTGIYDKALDAYDIVLERYPKGNKASAAHYKKGMALLRLKKRDSAKREFQILIRRFPKSEEAALAREQLKSIGP